MQKYTTDYERDDRDHCEVVIGPDWQTARTPGRPATKPNDRPPQKRIGCISIDHKMEESGVFPREALDLIINVANRLQWRLQGSYESALAHLEVCSRNGFATRANLWFDIDDDAIIPADVNHKTRFFIRGVEQKRVA